ncbi:hybrid sensor histidine kinase/response regulator [Bowmanella denitrificans]|uniref:hybrid sensor histidine kinase/response regulator n=1 Tax=Bowmanella denitrificans TaxID=366582 RepID=UPI000C9C1E0A|nr:GAF domain-containing hybrid sensor histidine kinase/response regulator [Bowmanella denitrificans]
MQIARLPDTEQQRLEALAAYEILDTDAEQAFDDLAKLAAQLCQTPIALISLVDPSRQWFKAKVGVEACETSRDIAFCAHAILQTELFEITDARQDPRFANNPLVTGPPHIRFYAGTQLVTPQGHAIGTLCTISDQPKSLTQEQRQGLESLGRAVISQMELRRKLKDIRRINQYKTDFLSNMSHELRTPLNAILAFSQLMQEQLAAGQMGEQFGEHLQHIQFSGQRLLAQINNVLDLSKVEAGKMPLHRQDFNARLFFQQVHGMLSGQAHQKGLQFDLNLDEQLPQWLHMDMEKLGQILTNLLSNAIKFTPSGKSITTQVHVNKAHLLVAVKDQGIGIAEADQARLFERFEQADSPARKQGSGLGLSITKALVELMEGRLQLLSEPGKGTLIKVQFPLRLAIRKNSDSVLELPQAYRNQQILVVEDDPINQEVAKAMLSSLGLLCLLADSAEQAFELMAQFEPDAVFMDMNLPGMNGLQAASLVRKKHPKLPVVMLSADLHLRDIAGQQQAAELDFLSKPMEKQAIISLLVDRLEAKEYA